MPDFLLNRIAKTKTISLGFLSMEAGEESFYVFEGYEVNPMNTKKNENYDFAILLEVDVARMDKDESNYDKDTLDWKFSGRYCTIHYGIMTPLKNNAEPGDLIKVLYKGQIEKEQSEAGKPADIFHDYSVEIVELKEETETETE